MDKKPIIIFYVSRSLIKVQIYYTITEKELLSMAFALEKFASYLLGSKVFVYYDHSTLIHLLRKRDTKSWFIGRIATARI